MENKNTNNEEIKHTNFKNLNTDKKLTYIGFYLGADWVEGVAKDSGKAYSFGKLRADFFDLKKDGSEFKKPVEIMLDSKDQIPDASISEYTKCLFEFSAPTNPDAKPKFIRVVKSL